MFEAQTATRGCHRIIATLNAGLNSSISRFGHIVLEEKPPPFLGAKLPYTQNDRFSHSNHTPNLSDPKRSQATACGLVAPVPANLKLRIVAALHLTSDLCVCVFRSMSSLPGWVLHAGLENKHLRLVLSKLDPNKGGQQMVCSTSVQCNWGYPHCSWRKLLCLVYQECGRAVFQHVVPRLSKCLRVATCCVNEGGGGGGGCRTFKTFDSSWLLPTP